MFAYVLKGSMLYNYYWVHYNFALFFSVNTDDMAHVHLGARYVNQDTLTHGRSHGYDKPLFYNDEANGFETLVKRFSGKSR